MHPGASGVIFHIYFHPFCFCNPLSVCSWLSDGPLRVWSPGQQQLSFFLPTVVYMTEARAVKVWRPDRGGLMVRTVARATHKHFRDVNKCVHAQRVTIEVFSRLPHINCNLFFSRKYIKSFSVFEKRCGVPNYLLLFSRANLAHSYLFYSHMEVICCYFWLKTTKIRWCSSLFSFFTKK